MTPVTTQAISSTDRRRRLRQTALKSLSFRNISAIYIAIVLFVLFSLWVPDTFLTTSVWRSLLDTGALTALTAVGVSLPLAAGVFDLAVGAEIGLGAILVAWLLSEHHLPVALAIPLTVAVGALVGVTSGLLVTKAKIDSFITTLGLSSVLLALVAWISGGQQILGLGPDMQAVASDQVLGITNAVWIALIVAAVVWYVLQRTTLGRSIYATGGNEAAAKLAGIRTSTVIIGCLAACGAIAGLSGCLVSSQLAVGDPTIGPGYLLPVYAAAFLGSTQFRGGRYNVWGSVIAVYVLAIGVKGLQLGGAPTWIPDLFNGTALLLAVGLSRFQRTARKARVRAGGDQPSDQPNYQPIEHAPKAPSNAMSTEPAIPTLGQG